MLPPIDSVYFEINAQLEELQQMLKCGSSCISATASTCGILINHWNYNDDDGQSLASRPAKRLGQKTRVIFSMRGIYNIIHSVNCSAPAP